MTSLVFVNRCYWPDSEATGQLLTDLCEHLADQGHNVSVVCGQPNSPSPDAQYQSSGTEIRNKVAIHRLSHWSMPKRFPAARLLNLMSFTNAARNYLKRSRLAADVFVCETDPFLLPPVVANHTTRTGGRFVAYLQDIYPDVAEAIGKAKDGVVTRKIRDSLRSAYQSADRIIVLGSCMKDRLVAEPWGLDENKIAIIPNWADCEAIYPVGHGENELRRSWIDRLPGLRGKKIVMHSGNMGLTQRLDILVDATRHPSWPENAVLLLVGDGAMRARLADQVEENDKDLVAGHQNGSSKRVFFLPYQPRNRLCESLSAADLHVVSMHEAIAGCLCPSKLYGILAAGRPLIAIAPLETDLSRTVLKHRVGQVALPGDAGAIAVQIASLLSRDSHDENQRCRDLAVSNYDRSVVLKTLTNALTDVS